MRKLDLDFYSPKCGTRRLSTIVLAAGVAASVAIFTQYQVTVDDVEGHRLANKSSERSVKSRSLQLATPDEKRVQEETQQANEVIRQLNLPWNKLLIAIEESSNEAVALLAIQPDVKKHQIRVTAETTTSGDMLGYVKALQRTSALSNPYLQSHQIMTSEKSKPIRFTIIASWAGEK